MKKEKHKSEEIVFGEKIRSVKINERQHFLLYVSMLILFNCLLITSAWFVLIYLNEWYYWVICISIVALCVSLSFRNYVKIKTFHQCTLYDNALEVNSIWFNFKVLLKDIREMQVKESVLDQMFKLNTRSLEIKILNNRRKKFTLHFIEEDVVKLKQEITMMIDRDSSKNKENKKASD